MPRTTVRDLARMKAQNQKIPMITAYDYTTARLADAAKIPVVLVGDSLGMVVLGYDSTLPVTMEDMIHHTKTVARGLKDAMLVADMPFMSYQIDPAQAMANAGRLLQDGGAQSVKLEGGRQMAETVRCIVDCGIPLMGHIGLTPQSVHAFGGYRVQGRKIKEAEGLIMDAEALQEAGAYALVLELVPAPLAEFISRRLTIPTIGIGAGPGCDGQVQVLHDMLGLFTDFVPKHAKQYANLGQIIQEAFYQYAEEVRQGAFPTSKESFTMDPETLQELAALQ